MDTIMFSQQTRSCFHPISQLTVWHLNVSFVMMVSNGILIWDQTPSTINSFVWYTMHSCHTIRELKFDLCHKYNNMYSYYDNNDYVYRVERIEYHPFLEKRTVKSGCLAFLPMPIRTDVRWGVSSTLPIRKDAGWRFGGWCGPPGWCHTPSGSLSMTRSWQVWAKEHIFPLRWLCKSTWTTGGGRYQGPVTHRHRFFFFQRPHFVGLKSSSCFLGWSGFAAVGSSLTEISLGCERMVKRSNAAVSVLCRIDLLEWLMLCENTSVINSHMQREFMWEWSN